MADNSGMWLEDYLNAQRELAQEFESALDAAQAFIGDNINWKLSEADVAQFLTGRLKLKGIELGFVSVAFNENSTIESYEPDAKSAATIRREGWLSISFHGGRSATAGASRVVKLGEPPNEEQIKLFGALRRASDQAIAAVSGNASAGDIYGAFEEGLQQPARIWGPTLGSVQLISEGAVHSEQAIKAGSVFPLSPPDGMLTVVRLSPHLSLGRPGGSLSSTLCLLADSAPQVIFAGQQQLETLATTLHPR